MTHSVFCRKNVSGSRPKPNCGVHIHVLQRKAHWLAAGPHPLGQSLQSWKRCGMRFDHSGAWLDSKCALTFFSFCRNTVSVRSLASAYDSGPPCFNMWDFIHPWLGRSKNWLWVLCAQPPLNSIIFFILTFKAALLREFCDFLVAQDKDFLKPLLHKMHVNPPAEVSTSMKVFFSPQKMHTFLFSAICKHIL